MYGKVLQHCRDENVDALKLELCFFLKFNVLSQCYNNWNDLTNELHCSDEITYCLTENELVKKCSFQLLPPKM